MKKLKNLILLSIASIFGFLFIKYPFLCKEGVVFGIMLCGKVIIPSLFPFTMCVLFIMRSGSLNIFYKLSPISKKNLGLNFDELLIFIFSLIGGYPIGAKLINEAIVSEKISNLKAKKMLAFCINAGPAFTVSAIGSGILQSKELGIVLFFSNLLSSFSISQITRYSKVKNNTYRENSINKSYSLANNFVLSASDAAVAVSKICYFVVLFSILNKYLDFFSKSFAPLKFLSLILEITNAVTKTNNIFLISFLLGFGGISIWCQVISVLDNLQIDYKSFVFWRFIHGFLSMLFSFLIIKIFDITITVFSNQKIFESEYFYSGPALSVSIISMALIFIITLSSKKYKLKILEDIM